MQQTPQPQQPTPPPTPNPNPNPNPTFVFQGPGGENITFPFPRTNRDIAALKARREELSNQLQSVDSRRSKLISQLKQTGDPAAIRGLEDRLQLLDARQLQLESDIAQTGQQLTSAPAGLIATTAEAPFIAGMSSRQTMTLSILGIIFVLFPISVGIGRAIFKRAGRAAPPAVFTQTAERLVRLEGSVDAIAIEIERISEGQRFVTKLLSEGQAAPKLVSGQRAAETA